MKRGAVKSQPNDIQICCCFSTRHASHLLPLEVVAVLLVIRVDVPELSFIFLRENLEHALSCRLGGSWGARRGGEGEVRGGGTRPKVSAELFERHPQGMDEGSAYV